MGEIAKERAWTDLVRVLWDALGGSEGGDGEGEEEDGGCELEAKHLGNWGYGGEDEGERGDGIYKV